MTAGDVISGIVGGGSLTFQPAAGVEIMITWVSGNNYTGYGNSGSQCGITDGVNAATFYHAVGGYGGNNYRTFGFAENGSGSGGLKIGITNTRYLTINNSSYGNAGYSGIQMK